jgi:hypothetical protein
MDDLGMIEKEVYGVYDPEPDWRMQCWCGRWCRHVYAGGTSGLLEYHCKIHGNVDKPPPQAWQEKWEQRDAAARRKRAQRLRQRHRQGAP